MTESAKEKSEGWLSQARTLRSQNLWHALLQLPVPHSAGSDPEVSLLLAERAPALRQGCRAAGLVTSCLPSQDSHAPSARPASLWTRQTGSGSVGSCRGCSFQSQVTASLRQSGRGGGSKGARRNREALGSSAIPTSFCRPRGRILGSSRGGRRPGNPSAPDFWQPGGSPPGQSPTPEA